MGNWPAQSIQLVWFTPSSRKNRAAELFAELLEQECDSSQENKSPNPANPSFSTATGRAGTLVFDVTSSPGRIDYFVRPFELDPTSLELPTIADVVEQINKVSQRATAVSQSISDVNRVALIVNLIKKTETIAEANAAVAAAFGGLAGIPVASDLVLQLNARRKFKTVDDLQMNRLLRFSAAGFQRMAIAAGGSQPLPLSEEIFAASEMIDVNTVPGIRIFTNPELVTIWGELRDEALRLRAANGVEGLSQ
jgi:hypothetical protein